MALCGGTGILGEMSTILCLRRGGASAARPDPRLLWYVAGFAVERDGVRVGTVETLLPTLDGDVPATLVLRTTTGPALVAARDVEAVRFPDRCISVEVEPTAVIAGILERTSNAGEREHEPSSGER